MRGDGILKQIGIHNLRSLKDTGMVNLSPITVLVGENSSGKSSFLRTFPLLSQSLRRRTEGPILWAGDIDDFVDFGSLKESVTNDGKSKSVSFDFSFTMPIAFLRNRRGGTVTRVGPISVKYSFTTSQKENVEYVSKLTVGLNDVEFDILLDTEPYVGSISYKGLQICTSDGFKPHESKVEEWFFSSNEVFYHSNSIFGFYLPPIYEVVEDMINKFSDERNKKGSPKNVGNILRIEYDDIVFHLKLIGMDILHGTQLDNVDGAQLVSAGPSGKDNTNKSFIAEHNRILEIWRSLDEVKKQEYGIKCILVLLYDHFSTIESYIRTYFDRVHYIAPLRATAERYYRLRNYAIDEVDYQGKNLSMYLNSLKRDRMEAFQKWTQEAFGFHAVVSRSEGHISLRISLRNDNKETINISDTGFGYSQILPIITQLWNLSTMGTMKGSRVPLVIAIEQPELHLHPALQARLADAFIASLKLAEQHGYELQLLLETHSETIVNRFGQAIASEKIRKDDVSVVLFSKDLSTNLTTVSESHYDDNGYLTDWPIGFFAPKGRD